MVCSIDGCLTNGHIYVSGDQKEIISYDVKDAIGISLLKKSGIEVCAPEYINVVLRLWFRVKEYVREIRDMHFYYLLQNLKFSLHMPRKLLYYLLVDE